MQVSKLERETQRQKEENTELLKSIKEKDATIATLDDSNFELINQADKAGGGSRDKRLLLKKYSQWFASQIASVN